MKLSYWTLKWTNWIISGKIAQREGTSWSVTGKCEKASNRSKILETWCNMNQGGWLNITRKCRKTGDWWRNGKLCKNHVKQWKEHTQKSKTWQGRKQWTYSAPRPCCGFAAHAIYMSLQSVNPGVSWEFSLLRRPDKWNFVMLTRRHVDCL